MKDFVKSAIARNLQVSEHSIALWRITVGAGSQTHSRFGAAPTPIEAELEVTLMLGRADLARLEARAVGSKSSLVFDRISPVAAAEPGLFVKTFVDVTLCHGKDTQHIFKALHQTMIVRGRQKGKR